MPTERRWLYPAVAPAVAGQPRADGKGRPGPLGQGLLCPGHPHAYVLRSSGLLRPTRQRPYKGQTPRLPFCAGSQRVCVSPCGTCVHGTVTAGLRLVPKVMCSSRAAVRPWAPGGCGERVPETLPAAGAFPACSPPRDTALPTQAVLFCTVLVTKTSGTPDKNSQLPRRVS